MNLDEFRRKNRLIRSSYRRERTLERFAGRKILKIGRERNIPGIFCSRSHEKPIEARAQDLVGAS